MARNLIITADDHGMCKEVNQAIEECVNAGTVHATSVMVNMPSFGGLSHLRKEYPQLSIGIHWNLTQGRPIYLGSLNSQIVNDVGEFRSFADLRWRWVTRRVAWTEIRSELHAQYLLFREIAGEPDFWNTHQNVHVNPGLFEAFVALARELGIIRMRSPRWVQVPRDMASPNLGRCHPVIWLKGQIVSQWARRAERRGVLMPNGRIPSSCFNLNMRDLENLLRRIRWGSVDKVLEIAVHPAISAESALFGSMTFSRVSEYKLFRDPNLAIQLKSARIEMIGFKEIFNAEQANDALA